MDGGQQYCDDPTASMPVADALANLLDQPQYASRTDLLVVSFSRRADQRSSTRRMYRHTSPSHLGRRAS